MPLQAEYIVDTGFLNNENIGRIAIGAADVFRDESRSLERPDQLVV
jgi:hypothetical protein